MSGLNTWDGCTTSQTDPLPLTRLHLLAANWRSWRLKIKLSPKGGLHKRSQPICDVSASGLSCTRLHGGVCATLAVNRLGRRATRPSGQMDIYGGFGCSPVFRGSLGQLMDSLSGGCAPIWPTVNKTTSVAVYVFFHTTAPHPPLLLSFRLHGRGKSVTQHTSLLCCTQGHCSTRRKARDF